MYFERFLVDIWRISGRYWVLRSLPLPGTESQHDSQARYFIWGKLALFLSSQSNFYVWWMFWVGFGSCPPSCLFILPLYFSSYIPLSALPLPPPPPARNNQSNQNNRTHTKKHIQGLDIYVNWENLSRVGVKISSGKKILEICKVGKKV